METKLLITQSRLKELLHYAHETGVFTRLVSRSSNAKAGDVAGCLCNGYWEIGVDRKRYYAHRLAFLYMTGSMPSNQCDHINHIRTDNRWCNLREVSNQVNHCNRPIQANNTSGVTGVGWFKRDCKWKANIKVMGKNIHLGYFFKIEDAVSAREAADIRYGFHENHGGEK